MMFILDDVYPEKKKLTKKQILNWFLKTFSKRLGS